MDSGSLADIIGEKPIGISFQLDRETPILVFTSGLYFIRLDWLHSLIYYEKPSTDEFIQDVYMKVFENIRSAKITSTETYTTIEIRDSIRQNIENEIVIEEEILSKLRAIKEKMSVPRAERIPRRYLFTQDIIDQKLLGVSYPIDRFRPILVYENGLYLINYYDEHITLFYGRMKCPFIREIYDRIRACVDDVIISSTRIYTIIDMKIPPGDYIENEITIDDKRFLSYLETAKDKYHSSRRQSMITRAYKLSKYDRRCISNFNVTEYVKKFGLNVEYETTITPLASFDIRRELETPRSIGSDITGEMLENMLTIILSNPSVSFEDAIDKGKRGVISHANGYTNYVDEEKIDMIRDSISSRIFEYIKEVAKNLHVRSFTGERENGYLTLTNTYCVRSSPDLIINENEVYDVKVRNIIDNNANKQLFMYARGFEQNYGTLSKCGIINLYTNELIIYKFKDLHKEIIDRVFTEFALSKHFNYLYEESFSLNPGITSFPSHKLEIVYCKSSKKEKSKFHQFLKTRNFVLDDPSIEFDRIWTMPRDKKTFHAINTCYMEIDVKPAEELEKKSGQRSRFALSLFTTDTDVEFMKRFNYECIFVFREIPVPSSMKDHVIQYVDLDTWNYNDYERPISEELKRSRIGMHIKINRYKRLVHEDEKHDLYYCTGPGGLIHNPITSLMISLDDLFTNEKDSRIKYED